MQNITCREQPLNIVRFSSFFACVTLDRLWTQLGGGKLKIKTFDFNGHPTMHNIFYRE
jgi:hypothetical protein